ncbi:MAG: hypothetical protein NZM11_11585, partial [Anaerolineales bacterium]|nr:hypothetical protein [Anaerolineales bacterium]
SWPRSRWRPAAWPSAVRGRAWRSKARSDPRGRTPMATRGGLKARGHPVGATGVYQIVEVTQQLRGGAGKMQVPGAPLGLAQNIGDSGATVLTHLLCAG